MAAGSDSPGDGPQPEILDIGDRPGARAGAFNSAMATLGIAGVVFVIGVIVGFPLATFGVDFFTENAGVIFAVLFGFFLIALVVAMVVLIFRRPLWERLFRRGEVEMERFARPLANVARFAALQKVAEATESARDLAELVLARYAWVATRRWLMATITAFIAAIAALAGSALLFQQNQLLRTQIGLMQDQNARIAEQNRFIEAQIELGEAQRSTSIVPEILEIGSLVGAEVQQLTQAGDAEPSVNDLSPALQARIIAASNAARPYRYLRTPLADLDDGMVMKSGLLRRTDIPSAAAAQAEITALIGPAQFEGEQRGVMSDRPVSPERGQLIATLATVRVNDIGTLNFSNFSFAEVRTSSLSAMTFQYAMLRFADFDHQTIIASAFNGAYLEHARFRNARISNSALVAVRDTLLNFDRPTELAGADFSGAIINYTQFTGSRGTGIRFDNAVLHNVGFQNAEIVAGTFRGTIFGTVDFSGTNLASVDFDGAIVFDPAFLDTVASQAAPETFVRERFAIEPITPEDFARHPRWADAWLDGAEDGQAYRITRIAPFE